MAYVIGNTITMPESQGTLDLLLSSLAQGAYSGWQNYLTQQALNQLRQQYNLVPVAVRDENGQLRIEWQPRVPTEERIERIRSLSQRLGIPITGLAVDKEGNIVANADILKLYELMLATPGGQSRGFGDILRSIFGGASANAATPNLLTNSLALQGFYVGEQPKINTGGVSKPPINTGTPNTAFDKKRKKTNFFISGNPVFDMGSKIGSSLGSFVGQAIKSLKKKNLQKNKIMPKSFLEVRLKWPSGEEVWVDYDIWRRKRNTEFKGVKPLEVKPKDEPEIKPLPDQLPRGWF